MTLAPLGNLDPNLVCRQDICLRAKAKEPNHGEMIVDGREGPICVAIYR